MHDKSVLKARLHVYVCCDFFLLMNVKDWMSYDDVQMKVRILRTFITHLLVHMHHAEEENRIRNHNENCKRTFKKSNRVGNRLFF